MVEQLQKRDFLVATRHGDGPSEDRRFHLSSALEQTFLLPLISQKLRLAFTSAQATKGLISKVILRAKIGHYQGGVSATLKVHTYITFKCSI
ncbi:hypothetical protein ACVVI9_005303 [Escherichia coli]